MYVYIVRVQEAWANILSSARIFPVQTNKELNYKITTSNAKLFPLNPHTLNSILPSDVTKMTSTNRLTSPLILRCFSVGNRTCDFTLLRLENCGKLNISCENCSGSKVLLCRCTDCFPSWLRNMVSFKFNSVFLRGNNYSRASLYGTLCRGVLFSLCDVFEFFGSKTRS